MSTPDFSTIPRGRPRARDLALLAGSLLLALLSARAALSAHGERDAARARVADVRREIDAAKGRLRALEARTGPAEGPLNQAVLTAEAPAARVIAQVAGVLPPDVRLDGISLSYGRDLALEMRIVARDPRAFDRVLGLLQSWPLLRDVRPGAENREGEVRTTVRATWVNPP